MKFILQNSIHSGFPKKCRFGKICSLIRSPDLELETPILLVNTKAGSVMHLSHEVLIKIDRPIHCLQVSLSNSARCYEGVKGFKKGIAEFAGMKGYLTYCSVHDPTVMLTHGRNERNSISLYTETGRKVMNVERYMDMMEAFQPDIYEVLSDGYNDGNSSNRRLSKSVVKSITFFDECMKRHHESHNLRQAAVFGVIEGGHDLRFKEKVASHLIQNSDMCGYVISGLHSNGPDVEHMSFKTIRTVVHQTLCMLPEDKVKVVHGCFRPDVIISLIELGIDIFDSSLVDIVTNRGSAFVFGWEATPRNSQRINGILSPVNNVMDMYDSENDESSVYKLEICLQDKAYFDDFGPLVESCSCLSCQKHTRAYIHHLYTTKEMLGPVLLMIHNLHHYLSFFSFIRKTIREGHSVKII